MAVGAGLWIKLPVILAVPALLLLLDGWRHKLRFLAVAGLAAFSTYLPAFLIDPKAVYANVFGYRGQLIQTTGQVAVWGWCRVLLFTYAPLHWLQQHAGAIEILSIHCSMIAIGLILVLVWRRRACRSTSDVCATIAASYTLIYGMSEYWSFQYFAWSVPFWFFLPAWYPVSATLFAGGYICLLYAFVCGNPFLLGDWDFVGHPVLAEYSDRLSESGCVVFSGQHLLVHYCRRHFPKTHQFDKSRQESYGMTTEAIYVSMGGVRCEMRIGGWRALFLPRVCAGVCGWLLVLASACGQTPVAGLGAAPGAALPLSLTNFAAENELIAGPAWSDYRLTLEAGRRQEAVGPFFSAQQTDSEWQWSLSPLFCYTRTPDVDWTESEFLYPLFTWRRFGTEYRIQLMQLLSFSGGKNPGRPRHAACSPCSRFIFSGGRRTRISITRRWFHFTGICKTGCFTTTSSLSCFRSMPRRARRTW